MSVSTNDQVDSTTTATATTTPRVVASRFQNKTAIVTGAGSGIGRAVVLRLIAEGASVLGVDVNEAGLKETVQLASSSERLSVSVASVTNEQKVKELVNEYVTREGHLDTLINMAGIIRASHSTETTLEEFKAVMDVNLIGAFLMCRTCLPHLLITKGNIVNTSSITGLYGHPYMAAYSASKGAIIALTKSLAREYILQGVRVNAVAPGGTDTSLSRDLQLPEGINEILFASLIRPDQKLGRPEEIAGVVAMLASDDGSYVNGEVIQIDGGCFC